MSKQIQRDKWISIAPGIEGGYENRIPVAIDKRNGRRLDPTDLNDKITIYEREVKEWFLNPALALVDQESSFNNSFIVLMICMSYIEGVEQYKTGVSSAKRPGDCFGDSVNRIYPNKFRKEQLNALYNKIRCGLFHNGMVKGGVVFSDGFAEAIQFREADTIEINPRLLLESIVKDFENYIADLRNTNNSKLIRENFDRMFTVL